MVTALRKTGFLTAFIIPFLIVTGFYAGGWYNFSTVVFAFVVLPLIDWICGTDPSNVPAEREQTVSADAYYRLITYAWTVFQFIFFGWAVFVISGEGFGGPVPSFAFTLSFAIMTGGIGITVAHELGHKRSRLERFCGKALLMTVCYMHFYIEHNRGHHVHVATPADPATARKGENFYAFWLRSVVGGYRHAWTLEKESLLKKGKPVWSAANEMIRFAVLQFLFCAIITIAASLIRDRVTWEVPLFFVVQSVLAFTLLELVNYVEHYGILRRELSPGRYERVNPLHSWNASHLISNFFLFQLQRHSDHHAYAHKRYQVLRHYDESPQLPLGYPAMILAALVPPLWFRLIDPRLQRWQSVSGQGT